MKILYIFPHPDDESFGPAPAIAAQVREGFEVYLLTLTRGEATRQRFRLGVPKEEMGEIRSGEMRCVEKVLGLHSLTILDFPDGQLKEVNPLEMEGAVSEQIRKIKPDVVVTYPVHGVSGFEDHLVTHAVVKRAYCTLKADEAGYLRRLAFFTWYSEESSSGKFDLKSSEKDEIDCRVEANDEDYRKFEQALACYETYQQVIEESRVKEEVGKEVSFEFFRENFDPPLQRITDNLPN